MKRQFITKILHQRQIRKNRSIIIFWIFLIGSLSNCSIKTENGEYPNKESTRTSNKHWDNSPIYPAARFKGTLAINHYNIELTYTVQCEDPTDTVQCFHILYDATDYTIYKVQTTTNVCASVIDSKVVFNCNTETFGKTLKVTPSCFLSQKGLNITLPKTSLGMVRCPVI